MEILVLECPHCHGSVVIDAQNCGIFRHAVFKDTGVQINPHTPKKECDDLRDEIWGCGGPFSIKDGKIEKCEYI
jgi:hypothetical protein